MSQSVLPKGANTVIAAPLNAALQIELRWTAPSATEELDLFLLLLNTNGRVTHNSDIIFYNQPEYAGGVAKYVGRNDTGAGHAHNAELTLGRLPDSVHTIAIAKLALQNIPVMQTGIINLSDEFEAEQMATPLQPEAKTSSDNAGIQAAGFYPDPEGVAPYRYWDGESWTSRVRMKP